MKSYSDYGKTSNAENFAESVACYVINPKAFKKKFPNRAKLLEEIFGLKKGRKPLIKPLVIKHRQRIITKIQKAE